MGYGVLNDGAGNLAGYGWSDLAGWISFSCINEESCATKKYGVTYHPATETFSGRAWSEDLGWITVAPSGAPDVPESTTRNRTKWMRLHRR